MNFRVEISETAEEEANRIYDWVVEHSADHGPRALPSGPPENRHFQQEIRQLICGHRRGRYRILFSIRGDTVTILHMVYGAREFKKA